MWGNLRKLDGGTVAAIYMDSFERVWETALPWSGQIAGAPTVNDEASDVRWVATDDLDALDIHPTQWRQLRDYLNGTYPHVD